MLERFISTLSGLVRFLNMDPRLFVPAEITGKASRKICLLTRSRGKRSTFCQRIPPRWAFVEVSPCTRLGSRWLASTVGIFGHGANK
jgi:hypothetical protein